jgi:hypothetical protein
MQLTASKIGTDGEAFMLWTVMIIDDGFVRTCRDMTSKHASSVIVPCDPLMDVIFDGSRGAEESGEGGKGANRRKMIGTP